MDKEEQVIKGKRGCTKEKILAAIRVGQSNDLMSLPSEKNNRDTAVLQWETILLIHLALAELRFNERSLVMVFGHAGWLVLDTPNFREDYQAEAGLLQKERGFVQSAHSLPYPSGADTVIDAMPAHTGRPFSLPSFVFRSGTGSASRSVGRTG